MPTRCHGTYINIGGIVSTTTTAITENRGTTAGSSLPYLTCYWQQQNLRGTANSGRRRGRQPSVRSLEYISADDIVFKRR